MPSVLSAATRVVAGWASWPAQVGAWGGKEAWMERWMG